MFKSTTILLACLLILTSAQEIIFEWNYLNFTWPTPEAYERAINDKTYIPENNVISGIKVNRDRVYLSLPRYKSGVPATLASIARTIDRTTPLLEPYPNWAMQKVDDCSALQHVQSMEIDPASRMWLLENGRAEILSDSPRDECPPRLIVLDLMNDGKVLLDYEFPEEVARRESVFLNDIVLDHEDGGWAFITDYDAVNPGIIVFSLRDRASWKVSHDRSMRSNPDAREFLVEGSTALQMDGPVDGIALSPVSTAGDRTLYYSPLSSYEIFSVPVNELKNRAETLSDERVSLVGVKASQTDGMQISATGILYYGQIGDSAVYQYDTIAKPSFTDTRLAFYRSSEYNQWPDSFSMCDKGWLWWTSNRLQNFLAGAVDLNAPNYHVIAKEASGKSYQYHEDGSHPELPEFDVV